MALVQRYVNTDSTAGGDGTTNNTTGATRAYATLTSWETAEDANLVSDGDTHNVKCDGTTTKDSTFTQIVGWTTSASNNLTLEANSGSLATTTRTTTGAYIHSRIGDSIVIAENYVTLRSLNIEAIGNGADEGFRIDTGVSTTDSTILIDSCYIYCGGATGTLNVAIDVRGGQNLNIFNTIIEGLGSTGNGIDIDSGATSNITEVYNSVIYNCNVGIINNTSSATLTCKNVASFSNTDDFSIQAGDTVDYCASDDGDGTNSVSPSDWSTVFEGYTASDFGLKTSDTELQDAGIGPSSDAVVPVLDIDGNSRSGVTADIGAHETIAAGLGILYRKNSMQQHITR